MESRCELLEHQRLGLFRRQKKMQQRAHQHEQQHRNDGQSDDDFKDFFQRQDPGLNWWTRWDSNPQSVKNTVLSRTRMPIPPLVQKTTIFDFI